MTKTFDLEEFKLFVAGKPADERYDPSNPFKCALGQFGMSIVTSGNAERLGVPRDVYWAAVPRIHGPALECDFGALLSRLNSLPAARSPAATTEGDVLPCVTLTNSGE